MSFGQVQDMLETFNAHVPPGSPLQLHVGVMMSHETLNHIPDKWTRAFPPNEAISGIFTSDDVMNCLHYADYKSTDVERSLFKALEFGGTGIHALQLDMVWPEPAHIDNAVRASRKHVEVILQVGRQAFVEANHDPSEIVERLWDYDGIIHRVLLDKSMGTGLGMDADFLLPYARAIRKAFPDLGLVFSGGLGPDTMHLVEPLIEAFPGSSIDAQGKLRPSGNSLDPRDPFLSKRYLVEAIQTLR